MNNTAQLLSLSALDSAERTTTDPVFSLIREWDGNQSEMGIVQMHAGSTASWLCHMDDMERTGIVPRNTAAVDAVDEHERQKADPMATANAR